MKIVNGPNLKACNNQEPFCSRTNRSDRNKGSSVPRLGAFLSQNVHPNSELFLWCVWVGLSDRMRGNVGNKDCWPLKSYKTKEKELNFL